MTQLPSLPRRTKGAQILADIPGNLSDNLTDKCCALAKVALAARDARLALGSGGLVTLVEALKTY